MVALYDNLTRPARTYLVKELFGPTLQGEGTHAGRACVFLRFAVCNLQCTWCDTDFASEGAERLTADEIVRRLALLDRQAAKMVVVTGGEPALHWDEPLAEAIKSQGFSVHMESNGTRPLKAPVDWLTVSPKPQFHRKSDRLLAPPELCPRECKVVVDDTVSEETLASYERHYAGEQGTCEEWFVQPCMDERYQYHLAHAIALIGSRPRWRLSLQLHKIIGLP